MKTAICLSGELRSIDKCIDGWKEKILPKLGEYDLFYFAWDDDPDKSKLKYLNQLNLKDIIIELNDYMKVHFEHEEIFMRIMNSSIKSFKSNE